MSALPALLVAGAVLAGTVAAELAFGAGPPPARPAPAPAAGAAPLPAANQTPAQVAVLLARPPLTPSRRPDAVSGADDPRLPHLTGILVTGQDRRAIFAGRDGGLGTVVGQGDTVGAFRVQDISPEEVTLAGADGAHTVRPTFSTAPPAAAPLAGLPGLGLPQLLPPPTLGAVPPPPIAPVPPAAGTPR